MRINSKIIDGAIIITVALETERYAWLDVYENDTVSLTVQVDLKKGKIASFQIDDPSLEKLDIATLVLENSKNIIKWLGE